MKKCPQCGREYDLSMSFCLDDGAELLYGPASMDAAATAIFPSPSASDNATAVLPVPSSEQGLATNSIAVLPFTNMSADEENQYFCDGLAEELLNALSKIDDLRVAARTSAFSLKGKNITAAEISRILKVNTILDGSVRRASDRLRISVQLVSAAEGYQLWSERYDREMKDIFDVQDEIALAVVDALKVKLLGQQRAAVLKRQTSDPAALDAYLQGLSYFTKFTPEFFSRSIDRFEAAIAIDPNYAAAYAGLAECFSELSFFSSTGDWTGKAKAAAARSVELDDSLGRAHNALAITLMYFDLDFAAAEREFRRAIALEPGSAHIQMWFAWFLGLTRRFDDAHEQMNQARALDPLSPLIAFGIGAISLWAGKNEDAIEHLIRLTEMNPEFPLAYSYLAEAYIEKGDVAAAVSAIEAAPTSLDDPISLSAVAYVYACAGERDRARKIIDDLIASDRADPVDVQIAQVYAAFGEFERAFEWLEKAFQRHSVWLMWTGVEPAFKALRSDERFHRFLNRMGLSQRTV